MTSNRLFPALIASLFYCAAAHAADDNNPQLDYPTDYRNWIFLTSGLDMNYDPLGKMMGHHMFDNVFVDPASYKSFIATGRWPDKTMLVKEVRGTHTKLSINKSGFVQATELMELEVHVKDEKRFADKWAFFVFGDNKPATMIPKTAQCYSCHGTHGAVDNTFVQFYPTLIPVAEAKNTLSESYRKENAKP